MYSLDMRKCEAIWNIKESVHYYFLNEWLNKCPEGEERFMWAEKILEVFVGKEKGELEGKT